MTADELTMPTDLETARRLLAAHRAEFLIVCADVGLEDPAECLADFEAEHLDDEDGGAR